MSAFLGFESYLITLGATPQTASDTFKTSLTGAPYSWRCVAEAIVPIAYGGTFSNPTYPFSQTSVFHEWGGSGAGNVYVQLAAGFVPTKLRLVSSYRDSTYGPQAFTLDSSPDGTTWTTWQTWTAQGPYWLGGSQCMDYTVTGGAPSRTFWRLSITTAGTSGQSYLNCIIISNATGQTINTTNYLDFIPPSGESLGGNGGQERLRWRFNPTTIGISSLCERTIASPQVIRISALDAGNIQATLTVNGTTVMQSAGSMSAGNTAEQNMRYLYEAIRASADANFTNWNWTYQYPAVQNADDTNQYICGICASQTANIAVTGTHVTVSNYGTYGPVGPQTFGQCNNELTLTVDYTNGYIYYMQVNKRGISLAIKCVGGFYGPIHCVYATNSNAVAATPTVQSPFIQPTPMELWIGWDGDQSVAYGWGYPTHQWGISAMSYMPSTSDRSSNATIAGGTPFSNWILRDVIQDMSCWNMGSSWNSYSTFAGSNMFDQNSNVTSPNDFQIHRLGMVQARPYNQNFSGTSATAVYSPVVDVTDWYKFDGSVTNEALCMVSDIVTVSTLSSSITASATSITVASAAGFAVPSGPTYYIIIENEVIGYTGISTNTFTGCTRGAYGTVASGHFITDGVSQGNWFTVINGGALQCGYAKPS